MTNLTDQQFRDGLRFKVQEAFEKFLAESPYIKALEAFGESVELLFKGTGRIADPIPLIRQSKNLTLRDKIHLILKEQNKLMTAREIMNILNEKYEHHFDFDKNFSGAFSQAYKKVNIRKYERADAPFGQRVVYGLQEWFDADTLKQEYKEKLGELI